MKIGRRGFFKALAAAPVAARHVADEMGRKLTGVQMGSIGGFGGPQSDLRGMLRETEEALNHAQTNPPPRNIDWRIIRRLRDDAVRDAIKRPKERKELEAILYEEHQHVYRIDPDLAGLRSISLNAKIAYQRRRNVERHIDRIMVDESINTRVRKWKSKIFSSIAELIGIPDYD